MSNDPSYPPNQGFPPQAGQPPQPFPPGASQQPPYGAPPQEHAAYPQAPVQSYPPRRGGSLLWLYIVIGVLVLAGAVVLTFWLSGGFDRSSRRNSSTSTSYTTNSTAPPATTSTASAEPVTIPFLARGYWKTTCSDTTSMYFSSSTKMFQLRQNGQTAQGSFRLVGNTAFIRVNGRESSMQMQRIAPGMMRMTFNGQTDILIVCTDAGTSGVAVAI